MDQPTPADSDADRREASDAHYQAAIQARDGISLATLRALSEDELVQRYDALTTPSPDAAPGTWSIMEANDYLQELARRDASAQGNHIERMTERIERLT